MGNTQTVEKQNSIIENHEETIDSLKKENLLLKMEVNEKENEIARCRATRRYEKNECLRNTDALRHEIHQARRREDRTLQQCQRKSDECMRRAEACAQTVQRRRVHRTNQDSSRVRKSPE